MNEPKSTRQKLNDLRCTQWTLKRKRSKLNAVVSLYKKNEMSYESIEKDLANLQRLVQKNVVKINKLQDDLNKSRWYKEADFDSWKESLYDMAAAQGLNSIMDSNGEYYRRAYTSGKTISQVLSDEAALYPNLTIKKSK